MTPFIVGATGHRFLAEADRIAAGVEQALDAIEKRFPGRPLVTLSALAEGADQLIAKLTLERPAAVLRAVLPVARDDYATEFTSVGSRHGFETLLARAAEIVELPVRATREASYVAAGEYVVERSDALIAIWNGLPALGKAGTATVVELARARSLPIAWVLAGNRRPGTNEPTTLGAEQGRLIMENL